MLYNKLESSLRKKRFGAMAVKLFEMKRLSSGMAAVLLGVDRVYFLLKLHQYGVPIIDLSEDELRSDLENA
jgi:predicted HTH domain antitoxin